MTDVSSTSRKIKTGGKPFLVRQLGSECAGDCRFASSSHTVKPEDASAIWVVIPLHNLLAELHPGALQTMILMLPQAVAVDGSFGTG